VSKANKRERQRQNREQRREYEEKLAKRRRLWKTARTFAIIAVPIIIIGVVLSIANSGDDSGSSGSGPCTDVKQPAAKDAALTAPTQSIDLNQAYSATIKTSCGTIDISIDAQQYPISANNFVSLANQGFYDDLAVVRAAKGFVIQAGSPDQTDVGGPGYTIQAEVPTASPAYPVGTVAWAKADAEPAGSAGSQFFIVTGASAASLPADYAVIGKVTNGQQAANDIAKLSPKSGDGPPTKPVVMKKVTITTKGIVPPSTTPSSTP
jgi:cyclophilin family peptidyl-prolyl cis-trans isomerase